MLKIACMLHSRAEVSIVSLYVCGYIIVTVLGGCICRLTNRFHFAVQWFPLSCEIHNSKLITAELICTNKYLYCSVGEAFELPPEVGAAFGLHSVHKLRKTSRGDTLASGADTIRVCFGLHGDVVKAPFIDDHRPECVNSLESLNIFSSHFSKALTLYGVDLKFIKMHAPIIHR